MNTRAVFFIASLIVLAACGGEKNVPSQLSPQIITTPLSERVLSKEEQQKLTPEKVLAQLKAGNERFFSASQTERAHTALIRESSLGQLPKAIVLTCADLRIPPEDIFDQTIGDLEVLSISGNRPNDFLIANMELTCKKEGTKLIVVMGHDRSQAIRTAIDNLSDTASGVLIDSLKNAVRASADYPNQQSAINLSFVRYVAKKNIAQSIALITARSAWLKEKVAKGEIKIVGAYFDMLTGKVAFL
jgi:carbonic anhydrase